MDKKLRLFKGLWVDQIDLQDLNSLKLGSQIVSLNMEQLVLADKDEELLSIFQDSEYIIPDGIGLVWALKYLFGYKNISKLAGIDLAYELLEQKNRVILIGSSLERIEKLKNIFKNKIIFAHHGYFELNQKDDLKKKIVSFEPDLLLVGMGSPKQERFIYEIKKQLPNTIMMGVGGSLDLWSGDLKRAPRWMINMNLEWLFRIIQEPYRVKRLFNSIPRYVFLLARERFKG